MTFAELQTEFFARGFDDLNDAGAGLTRAKRWLNDALQEIYDTELWPFLQASSSGAAPLTIADLGRVITVADTTHDVPLAWRSPSDIYVTDSAINDTGSASWWYLSSSTVVTVYPADTTASVTVRYSKTGVELSAAGDTPLLPSRFHDLIVDGAAVRAYKNKDNFEAGQFVRDEWERGLERMRTVLLHPHYDTTDFIQATRTFV